VFEIEIISEIVYYIVGNCDTLIIIMDYFYLHQFDLCWRPGDPISLLRLHCYKCTRHLYIYAVIYHIITCYTDRRFD